MTNKDLQEALAKYDPNMEVAVRLAIPDEPFEGTSAGELDGEYAFITDERNVVGIEFGRVVIIGDVQP